jgi:hypothetical protein
MDADFMKYERAVHLKDILQILGWSRSKFFDHKEELENCGAVFIRYEGRPPTKRICAFPSELRSWIRLKASKREML